MCAVYKQEIRELEQRLAAAEALLTRALWALNRERKHTSGQDAEGCSSPLCRETAAILRDPLAVRLMADGGA